MQTEQAVFLREFFLAELEGESQTHKKVIAAVPADKGDYTPAEPSMPALQLAWHIANADVWFLNSIIKGEFGMDDPTLPADVKTPADIIAWYDANLPGLIQKVRGLSPEHLAAPIDFLGICQLPAVMYLSFSIRHGVHHRGQLSAYLRPMGAKVPGIYGPSADEPMVAASEA